MTSNASNMSALPSKAIIGHRVWFEGCDDGGQWRITDVVDVIGESLSRANFLRIDGQPLAADASWSLSAVVSNLRYTTSAERSTLQAQQAPLGRDDSACAVLIPIRKSPAWWALAQDDRRAIYTRSDHTPIGLDYIPAIARQLHHCRDLGEPYDFLTWFEFTDGDTSRFRELLKRLRDSEEWDYVDQEVEVWLTRA